LVKYILQLIIGIFILAVSTFIAWYEGSAIIDNSLEWKYSTPFTELFNIDITNGRDISQLDYFVYSAKFQPLFPTIMMVCVPYILSVIGYYLIKRNPVGVNISLMEYSAETTKSEFAKLLEEALVLVEKGLLL